MAGLGKRFPVNIYKVPKPLILIQDIPMIARVLKSLNIPGKYYFILKQDDFTSQLEDLLYSVMPECIVIKVPELTRGPAETCLTVRKFIDNDQELLIANSDQILWWDSELFLRCARTEKLDGLILTFSSRSYNNSYALISKEGFVQEIREKEIISDIALAGVHYWRKGSYFVESADRMINENNKSHDEFYVGPTYNYLIKSFRKIGVYNLSSFQHNPVGTPEDLREFEEKLWIYTR